MNAGTLAVVLVVAGGLIYKVTDFVRTVVETDFHWSVPTEWWAPVNYGLAMLFALAACTNGTIAQLVGTQGGGMSCPSALMAGAGFGTVATLIQKFKPSGNVGAPKGLSGGLTITKKPTQAPTQPPAA